MEYGQVLNINVPIPDIILIEKFLIPDIILIEKVPIPDIILIEQ